MIMEFATEKTADKIYTGFINEMEKLEFVDLLDTRNK